MCAFNTRNARCQLCVLQYLSMVREVNGQVHECFWPHLFFVYSTSNVHLPAYF